MKFALIGLLLVAGVLFAAPTYADSPQQATVQCVSPAPVPELAIGYGGGWGILEAMTDLSNVSPGSQIATYSDTGLPIGVYVVNPGTEAISILVYYKDLQRDVSIGSRDTLYYEPPVGADRWITICYLQEVAPPRWEQPTMGVIVPAGTKLLVPVVISIPGNATLGKPTYLALEFAQADEAMIMFRQQALFLIVPVPAASSPVIYMVFAGGLCVLVIAIYLFTLRRRRAR
jgi:hypothetical protein